MPRRLGNLPVKSGDSLVFRANGEETSARVKRVNGRKIVAIGGLKKFLLSLAQRGDNATLEIEVSERDAEGREALHE